MQHSLTLDPILLDPIPLFLDTGLLTAATSNTWTLVVDVGAALEIVVDAKQGDKVLQDDIGGSGNHGTKCSLILDDFSF